MADVTTTQQEIEQQRRQALEDMAQLGYRTGESQATQQSEYNRQAAANAAFTQQMASNINAPQALQSAMMAQNQHSAGQGAAALNNSQARDQQYRSGMQTENELFFDRLSGLVPLYQQAAAAAAAARSGGGGGGGGGGGSTPNAGGFFDSGMSSDDIQKAGYALADQERARRKGTAVRRARRGAGRGKSTVRRLRSQRDQEQKARRMLVMTQVNNRVQNADLDERMPGIGVVNNMASRLRGLPFGLGDRAARRVGNLGVDIARGDRLFNIPDYNEDALRETIARTRTNRARIAAEIPAAMEELVRSQVDAAQYNDAIEAQWPWSNDRIALAQEQLQSQQFPVDPFVAQAAFTENFQRPVPQQQPEQLGYTEALRSTPEYQQGVVDIQALAQQGYSQQAAAQALTQAGYPAVVLQQILNDAYLPYDQEWEYQAQEG